MTVFKGLCMNCYSSNVDISLDSAGEAICDRCK